MSLFSFLKKRKTVSVKVVVYLDAGKGNARGAVVEMKNGKPHILYTILGEQRVGESINGVKALNASSLSSFEEILEQIARLLHKTSGQDISYVAEDVCCILASPYYVSHTSIIHYKTEKPISITHKLVADLLANDIANSPIRTEEGKTQTKKILHEKIVDIKINGYHSIDPYDKMADEISIAVFRTQVDLPLFDNLSRVIKKYTNAPFTIEPLSLAAFVSLRNRLDSRENFMFVTVGNEITEVSLVKQNILLETVSFPFGKYSLARLLGQKMGMSPDVALSKVGLYHDKKLHIDEMTKLKPIVEETQAEWFSYLEKTFVTLSEEKSVPDQVYLIIDTDLKDIFEETITQKGFASQALVPNGFTIHTLDTAKLADCCSFGLNIRFDTLLAISASFSGASKQMLSEMYPHN